MHFFTLALPRSCQVQVMVERQGAGNRIWYSKKQIHDCMGKVIAVDLGQRVQVRSNWRVEVQILFWSQVCSYEL